MDEENVFAMMMVVNRLYLGVIAFNPDKMGV